MSQRTFTKLSIDFFHYTTVEKKDRFLPHFGHFSKMPLLNLANMNLFFTFIIPKHNSDGNFRPVCAFMDFLQMFKVENFAS